MEKKDGSTRYDWNSIRQEYVTTNISLRKLAEKHNIKRQTLEARCSKDKWVEERERHKAKVGARVGAKIVTQQANEMASILADATEFSALVLRECIRAMTSGEQVSGAYLEHLTNSAKNAESLARISTGSLTRGESEKLAMDRERLEMDKTKNEYKKPDNSITVNIQGYEEGWTK